MSQLEPINTKKELPRNIRFVTHYYSKRDVMSIWGITDYFQFEDMLGERGKQILNWKPGKQRFSPNTVRELIEFVGAPLTISID